MFFSFIEISPIQINIKINTHRNSRIKLNSFTSLVIGRASVYSRTHQLAVKCLKVFFQKSELFCFYPPTHPIFQSKTDANQTIKGLQPYQHPGKYYFLNCAVRNTVPIGYFFPVRKLILIPLITFFSNFANFFGNNFFLLQCFLIRKLLPDEVILPSC